LEYEGAVEGELIAVSSYKKLLIFSPIFE